LGAAAGGVIVFNSGSEPSLPTVVRAKVVPGVEPAPSVTGRPWTVETLTLVFKATGDVPLTAFHWLVMRKVAVLLLGIVGELW
jgi:hypothetical protein